jgi:hypothetical protein
MDLQPGYLREPFQQSFHGGAEPWGRLIVVPVMLAAIGRENCESHSNVPRRTSQPERRNRAKALLLSRVAR